MLAPATVMPDPVEGWRTAVAATGVRQKPERDASAASDCQLPVSARWRRRCSEGLPLRRQRERTRHEAAVDSGSETRQGKPRPSRRRRQTRNCLMGHRAAGSVPSGSNLTAPSQLSEWVSTETPGCYGAMPRAAVEACELPARTSAAGRSSSPADLSVRSRAHQLDRPARSEGERIPEHLTCTA